MTPQENAMIEDLIRKVQQTPLTEKDPEAEELLLEGFGRDPDAIYKLAQTVLVQNLALNQARAQLQQLQQQAQPQQPARATSFLGSLLGHREPQTPPPPQYQTVPQGYQQVPYQQGPVYDAPPPQYAPQQPSAAGSFLRSAATTATGVAAGALAFEGIESLMHGFGHGGGGWGGGFGGYGAPPMEETVINNYYDEPREGGNFDRNEQNFSEHHEHEASFDDRPDNNPRVEEASYQPDTDPTSLDDGLNDDFGSDFGSGDDNLI